MMSVRQLHPAAVPVDDATLVLQARDGDERAFVQLYRRYARYVAGIACRLLGNDAEVDDVVQESFTDASGGLRGLRDPAGFRPWLASITVRRVHKRLARRRRWRWLTGEALQFAPQVSDPRDRARVEALYEALETVQPKLRIPWVLHHVEGETLPDVAKQCEVSLATVKRRIAEADVLIQRRLHGG